MDEGRWYVLGGQCGAWHIIRESLELAEKVLRGRAPSSFNYYEGYK